MIKRDYIYDMLTNGEFVAIQKFKKGHPVSYEKYVSVEDVKKLIVKIKEDNNIPLDYYEHTHTKN